MLNISRVLRELKRFDTSSVKILRPLTFRCLQSLSLNVGIIDGRSLGGLVSLGARFLFTVWITSILQDRFRLIESNTHLIESILECKGDFGLFTFGQCTCEFASWANYQDFLDRTSSEIRDDPFAIANVLH